MPRFAALVVTILAILIAISTTRADVDLWGHLRFGQEILSLSAIPDQDSYSFVETRPWINHEWAAEVLMAVVFAVGGQPGLVLLKLAVVFVVLALVAANVRHAGPDARGYLVVLVLTVCGILARAQHVRPQLFSLLCFSLLLTVMVQFDRGRRHLLLFLPPLMAVWANLHGGWLVGAGVMLLWTAGIAVAGNRSRAERLKVAGIGVASVAATLATPYGAGLWAFLAETVRLGREAIEEWHPITSMPAGVFVAWLASAVAAAIAVRRGRWPQNPAYVAIVVILGIASFEVNRLDAFFALAVMMLLGPGLVRALARRPVAASGERRAPLQVTLALSAAAGVLTIWVVPSTRCIDVHAGWYPEPEASEFVRERRLHGRAVPYFDWGEYIIWHHAGSLRVSIDGRRETVYTDESIRSHMGFYAGHPASVERVLAAEPDFVWVPATLPVVPVLQARGWHVMFKGPVSVILGRAPVDAVQSVLASACRCFPGP